MTNQSPRKTFSFKAQAGFLLFLLGAIAVLMSNQRPNAKVTVSGLNLDMHEEQVLKTLGQPDFQQLTVEGNHYEFWSDPVNVDPSLSVDFHALGVMIRVEGGRPEINGENVRKWSLAQVERALGPAEGASRGQALSSGGSIIGGDSFLKYPDRHLLVTWNPESGIQFILFAGTR